MSNTPLAGTGYGVQTAEIVPRLAKLHDTAIACNWGHYGTAIEWNGIPMFPAGKDKYSNDIIRAHAEAWKADWTITLYDVWPLRRDMFPANTASWVPVDHQPVPPQVVAWCQQANTIAMSRFGQRELQKQGIDATYIPHSVNTGIFRPTEQIAGTKPRAALGIPDDAFVVMIAAANQGVHPPRKAWAQMYFALSLFMRDHPDVWVYIHTDKIGLGGIDLAVLERATGLPLERVRYADPYSYASGRITQGHLAVLYSMSDVLLAPSMGEGFGLPVVEAQACGLPVIVSDFSAQPELCGSGWLVKGQPFWDEAQESWMFDPFIQSVFARLGDAYDAKGDQSLREQAIAFAQPYDSDAVFERHWVPFLAELEAKLVPAPLNRAERRRRKKAGKAA
jgi:glycosyltransferase involved in cell wall biosynthesis